MVVSSAKPSFEDSGVAEDLETVKPSFFNKLLDMESMVLVGRTKRMLEKRSTR
jgi:hypothetical protein